MLKQSISLMGFMGCGKSTIGVLIAKELELPFYDLDDEIEKYCSLSVNDIFKLYGEYFFRKIERKILYDLYEKPPGIISLGGGTPCFYENIKTINENTISFYIDLKVEELVERLIHNSEKRPLINSKSKKELASFIQEKLSGRLKYYNQANHRLLSKTLEQQVQEIVQKAI